MPAGSRRVVVDAGACAQFTATGAQFVDPFALVRLAGLMEVTAGRAEVKIGLIDGPVALNHPDLEGSRVHEIPGNLNGSCARAGSVACTHGTFVAGMLCARRGAPAPAICPDCTLLVRPIFSEATSNGLQIPSATPEELATAIIDCVEAGAHILNLSLALAPLSAKGERKLDEALDHAANRSVIVVAAGGNQAAIGSSVITRHPWVVPVVACDCTGKPISYSNLGHSLGRRGLSAPGENVSSLGTDGKPITLGGTSVAAPFVTGAIALLLSEFPNAPAARVKLAVTYAREGRRNSVVPPVLDAWAAYQSMTPNSRT
jgi:subtilisin family serine protease